MLELKDGANEIKFTVISDFQGKQEVKGKIVLWDYTTKIVISDVDGTVTRSDVPGHILPRLGMDWSQPNICNLYQKISAHGYEFLYLTARPIGMYEFTNSYIHDLKQ